MERYLYGWRRRCQEEESCCLACARLKERKSTRVTNEVKKQRPQSNLIIVAFDHRYQFSLIPPVTIPVRKGVKVIIKRRKVHMNTYLEMQWVATCGASLLLAELILINNYCWCTV